MTELKRKSNELARLIKAGFTPLESRRIAMAERRELPPSTEYMRYTTKKYRQSRGYTI